MKPSSNSLSLLIGTGNPGKVHEIVELLQPLPWRLHSLGEFSNLSAATEDGTSYLENAKAKARHYASATGLITLADDSGLEVNALNGAPGLFSARYAGDHASDADRRLRLISELSTSSAGDRAARFVCVVAVASPDGKVLHTAEGRCAGSIALRPRGHSGFGYDPLFIPEGYDKTFAELEEAAKNQISHRARALVKTRGYLLGNI
jgi:XTP/dITP diphosphohydrolase